MADETDMNGGAPSVAQGSLDMDGPGATLRRAREAKGLTLQDVATRTRIAQRQLEAIEEEDYAVLPGIPYAIGFARAYARAVDIDEVAIAAQVRHAVHASDMGANRYEMYEPADPKRVPSRMLAWTAAGIALIVMIAFGVWRTQMFIAPTGDEVAEAQSASPAGQPRAPAAAAPAIAGPVILTAIDDVWLRIYDDTGERLKDGLLKKGEAFSLPGTARNPMILTGRPQALSVTVGGKPVPALGPADRTIADVPISATALLARAIAQPAPASVAPGRTSPPARPAPAPAPAPAPEPSTGQGATPPAASEAAPPAA